MQRLARFFPVLFGVGVLGCSAAAPSTFEESAVEVDESFAALSSEDPGGAFGAMDEIASSADDSASSDVDADAGSDEARGDDDGHKGRGGRLPDRAHRGPRPHGRGHGVGLLVWYADLDALKVCQDLRATCAASEDTSSCGQQVKDCVKPVLAQAFKALCDERIAECDASTGTEKPCGHIREVCGAQGSESATTTDAQSTDSDS